MTESTPTPSPAESPAEAPAPTTGWLTVVHNDPVNLRSYVQWVFESYFGMDHKTAYMKMMQVHHNGRAVVSNGQREQMETDAQAMHSYGLWATIEADAQ